MFYSIFHLPSKQRPGIIISLYRLNLITPFHLWRILSGPHYVSANQAARIYRALHLIPFVGFPLQGIEIR